MLFDGLVSSLDAVTGGVGHGGSGVGHGGSGVGQWSSGVGQWGGNGATVSERKSAAGEWVSTNCVTVRSVVEELRSGSSDGHQSEEDDLFNTNGTIRNR